MRFGRFLSAVCMLFALWCAPAVASEAKAQEENAVLTGKVTDASGVPSEGAVVFVYGSPSVRQSAEFMSAPADRDGRYRVILPPGRYWAVARLKKSEGFGPLMPGDRHSGEPAEADLTVEKEGMLDFTVADLKEAMNMREKTREVAVRVAGRIVDGNGTPLAGVYAVAGRHERASAVPEYLSAWSDADGRYTLYLPKGKYRLGSAASFPPGGTYVESGLVAVEGDKGGVDIVRGSLRGK